MNPCVYSQKKEVFLDEVTVRDHKLKSKTVGNKIKSGGISSNLGNGKKGNEVATLIKMQNKKSILKSFKVNVVSNPYDSVNYRLKIYEVKDGVIQKTPLNNKVIPVTISMKKGLIEVELSNYHIIVYDDFAVSLELVDDTADNKIMFSCGFFGDKAYAKNAKEDDWLKLSVLSVGYHLDVLQEK